MIDKALIIIIFMYAVSFSILGVQYELGDRFNVTLVTIIDVYDSNGNIIIPSGTAIESSLLSTINEGELNQRAVNIVQANFTTNSTFYDKVETFTTGAAFVAWELVTLLSGTYIFNIMYLLGVPLHFVIGLLAIYLFLLARAIIGYVRGI